MTLRKAKNSLTILLGITIIASVGIVSSVTVSFGAHDWWTPEWTSSSHTYKCLSSLDSLADNTINDECDKFGEGTDKWDNVSQSNWNFSELSTGEVEVGGADLGSGTTIARTTITDSNDVMYAAGIEFNDQKAFSDTTQTSGSSYDWLTVSIHEVGHVLNVNDELFTSSSPMYYTLGTDTERRNLADHDKEAIQGKY